jgi:thioesterase domain-containing protein
VGLQKEWKSIVPIQPKGKKPPIFIVHGAGLNVIPFQALTKYFDHDQPFFGIQSKGMNRDFNEYESVEEIAASYVKEIEENHPSGELILAGFSLGGIIAFEMAKQIKDSGISLKKLFLFDTFATFTKDENIPANKIAAFIHREFYKKSYDLKLLFKEPRILMDMKKESIGKKIDSLLVKLALKSKNQETPILQRINKIKAMHLAACKDYKPGFYKGEVIMLRAGIRTLYFFDPEYLGWKGLSKSIRVIDIPCVHSDMFTAPNDEKLADIMKQLIAE